MLRRSDMTIDVEMVKALGSALGPLIGASAALGALYLKDKLDRKDRRKTFIRDRGEELLQLVYLVLSEYQVGLERDIEAVRSGGAPRFLVGDARHAFRQVHVKHIGRMSVLAALYFNAAQNPILELVKVFDEAERFATENVTLDPFQVHVDAEELVSRLEEVSNLLADVVSNLNARVFEALKQLEGGS